MASTTYQDFNGLSDVSHDLPKLKFDTHIQVYGLISIKDNIYFYINIFLSVHYTVTHMGFVKYSWEKKYLGNKLKEDY